ncbi:MAG: DUF4177 domain-containing protein [Boseongicola sp.]|nr:MAG: DUF4177 domain-containing protein [Boseongicola sp.]
MSSFEYQAVPAPVQAIKIKGVKSVDDRFARTISDVLNEMAADGWEFLRAETLPCEERKGLKGTQKSFQNLLIFKREIHGAAQATTPAVAVDAVAEKAVEPAPEPALPPLTLGESDRTPSEILRAERPVSVPRPPQTE